MQQSFAGDSSKNGFVIKAYREYFGIKFSIRVATGEYEKDKPLTFFKTAILCGLSFSTAFFLSSKIVPYAATKHLFFNFFMELLQTVSLLTFVWLSFFLILFRFFNPAEMMRWHGCEHKTIALLRKKLPLNEDNFKKASRLNISCGTGYLTILWLFSFLVAIWPFSERLLGASSYFVLCGLALVVIPLDLFLSLAFQYLFTTAEPTPEQIKEGLKVAEQIRMMDIKERHPKFWSEILEV